MRAAVYARVSTEDQTDNTSLDDQVRICRRYAEERGWSVVQVYREEGFTGTKADRPEWSQLMKHAAARAFDVVVVMNWKRFARNARIGLNISFELEELGVGLAVTELNIDTTTPQGRFLRLQFLGLAELDRDSVVEQMAKGQHAKARAGGWPASPSALPYGYRLEGQGRSNRVVHNEAEVHMVRLVVGWVVDEGLTRGQAALRLNAEGYRQRNGNPWHQDNLRDMLRGRGMLGELNWGSSGKGKYGDPIKIQVEPIVTEERWLALQEALSRRTRHSTQARPYLLNQGRMVSPCGEPYGGVVMSRTTRRIYRCRKRRYNSVGAPKCGCVNLTADTIEARVWAEVRDLLGKPERLMRLAADYYASRADQVEAERDELEQITTHLAKLERSLVYDVAEYLRQGVPAEVVKAATDRIRDEMAELRRRRAELVARTEDANGASERMRALIELAERASSRLADMTSEERAEVVELLRVRVTVLENTAEPRIRIEGVVPFPDSTAGGEALSRP
ncbi:recombinase family protein [Nonomuraea sp. LP-02]|uniref:recombinase family protein n=1 Tax=Nonomuraea sp. LP-02 TaxID=3097960 RepID=UPI002E2F172E|nr:recombinase family protein [Nonomuraea sp. LP-02]MED7929321.1 recombinase family protein [Nonomuraea sp. LP-02]